MTWASLPLAAIVAACLIPPLIMLYFLKLRRRETLIPSTLLWKQSVQDLQANAPFQRLRMNLLLFLQLLILVLLVLAIAQPEWSGESTRGSRTVLLIDQSASMTATDIGGTRLDEAKRLALEYVDRIKTGGPFNPVAVSEEVMVIAFSDEASVLQSFTTSKTNLRRAIERITPTHGGSSLKQALELARAYAINTDPEGAGRDTEAPATIHLYSDGRISDLQEQVVMHNEPLIYHSIGDIEGKGNVGIARVGARRELLDQTRIEVYVRVANFNRQPVLVDVELALGDHLLRTRTLEIPAATRVDPRDTAESREDITETEMEVEWTPGTNAVTFSMGEPRGITLGVSLRYDDDFAADNVAFVVVPPSKDMKVAVAGESGRWLLESTVEGIPFVSQLFTLSPSVLKSRLADGSVDQYDVVIVDHIEIDTIRPGRYLFFGTVPPLEGVSQSDTAVVNEALAWDERHAVNQNINYFSLFVGQYRPVTLPPEAAVLVDGVNGPLVFEISRKGVYAIVVPFEILRSNWPWDVNMVKFVQNAVDYLGHIGESITEESVRPGEPITARLPMGAEHIRVIRPDGEERPVQPHDPTLTTVATDLAGLYTLQYQVAGSAAEVNRDFAVNLFDAFESNIRPRESIQLGLDEVVSAGMKGSMQSRGLWPWAIMLGLLVMMGEWWVYNRRAYV